MTDELDRDPAPDPVLASALRDLGPEPPMEAVDWGRLERTIAAGARARARSATRNWKAGWWQPMAAWARPAIPLGLAAGVALFLILGSTGGSEGDAEGDLASSMTATEPVDPAASVLLGDELAQSVYRGAAAALLQATFTFEEPDR